MGMWKSSVLGVKKLNQSKVFINILKWLMGIWVSAKNVLKKTWRKMLLKIEIIIFLIIESAKKLKKEKKLGASKELSIVRNIMTGYQPIEKFGELLRPENLSKSPAWFAGRKGLKHIIQIIVSHYLLFGYAANITNVYTGTIIFEEPF